MIRTIPTLGDGPTPLNMVQPCHLIMVCFTPLWVEITYKITLSINMDNINRFFAHPKQFMDDSSPDNQFLDGLLSPLDYYKIKFRLTSFDTKSVQVCNITLWLRYWLGICWGTEQPHYLLQISIIGSWQRQTLSKLLIFILPMVVRT